MVASTLITDYFAEGLHSARPATPNIPTGATAIYYETDSLNTFAWSGSAWIQINGGGGAVVVQRAVASEASLATGITFSAAPALGNILIALVNNQVLFTNLVASGGWFIPANGTCLMNIGVGFFPDSVYSYTPVLLKIAGASESTTQTPVTNTNLGSIAMWEIHNGVFGIPVGHAFNNASGGSPLNVTYDDTKVGQLTLGAFFTNDSTPPSATSGLSNIQNANAAGASVTAFDNTSVAEGSVTVSTTNAANLYKVGIAIPVG